MIAASLFSTHRLRRPLFSLPVAALALFGLCASAHASSTVTDGGFEAAGGGNVYGAGQSIDGGAWTVTQGSVYIDSADPYVYAGSNSLNLTYVNPYVLNTVSQMLATVAGQTYSLNFWANADTANSFAVTANGQSIAGAPSMIANHGFTNLISNSAAFTDYFGSFTATSGSTTLNLSATGNPPLGSSVGSVLVDNVSVTAVTPEPGSFALVLTGLLGAGQMVRRRQQR